MPSPHEPMLPPTRSPGRITKLGHNWKEGDRIELVAMPDDPAPIESGARGTIDRIVDIGGRLQLGVAWDNGRTLHVVIPPDTIRRVTDE